MLFPIKCTIRWQLGISIYIYFTRKFMEIKEELMELCFPTDLSCVSNKNNITLNLAMLVLFYQMPLCESWDEMLFTC